jgi:hypothetical protein
LPDANRRVGGPSKQQGEPQAGQAKKPGRRGRSRQVTTKSAAWWRSPERPPSHRGVPGANREARVEDSDPIHSYRRAQAIGDGVLIDVSTAAREAGIRYPVALTAAVWERCVTAPPGVALAGPGDEGPGVLFAPALLDSLAAGLPRIK